MKARSIGTFRLRNEADVIAMLEALTEKPTRLEVGKSNYFISKAELVDDTRLKEYQARIVELSRELSKTKEERELLSEKVEILEDEVIAGGSGDLMNNINEEYLLFNKKLTEMLFVIKNHHNELKNLKEVAFESLKRMRDM